MGLSSLILGIIALLISLSIFKDISLILAVVGLVLGIVSLIKKKNKVMSIIGIALAIISLGSLFLGEGTTTTSSNETKNYKIGEIVTIKNNSDEYTLKVTNVKETKDRNEYADEDPKQVFLIDYTYECTKTKEGLYVSNMNFKIVDEKGEAGYSYPIDTKSPQSITAGTTCKAQMAFGVNNKSKSVKLQFYDNMFNGNPTAIYEIEL